MLNVLNVEETLVFETSKFETSQFETIPVEDISWDNLLNAPTISLGNFELIQEFFLEFFNLTACDYELSWVCSCFNGKRKAPKRAFLWIAELGLLG